MAGRTPCPDHHNHREPLRAVDSDSPLRAPIRYTDVSSWRSILRGDRPDGKRLASAGKVWDAQTGQELLSLKGHTSAVRSMAFSPDGKRLASGSEDSMVQVWDAQTGQELLTLKGHSGTVNSVVFSPGSGRQAAGALPAASRARPPSCTTPTLCRFSTSVSKTACATTPCNSSAARRSTRSSANCSASGPEICPAQSVKVWDAQTDQELLTLKGPFGPFMSVAFSPDGKRLATGSGARRTQDKPVADEVAGSGQGRVLRLDQAEVAHPENGTRARRLAMSLPPPATVQKLQTALHTKAKESPDYGGIGGHVLGGGLNRLNVRERQKVVAVEGDDAADAAGEHGRHELHIEDVLGGNRMVAKRISDHSSRRNCRKRASYFRL